MVATFKETCAPISRKYVAGQGVQMSNSSDELQFIWWHSSVFALEKQPKNLDFLKI